MDNELQRELTTLESEKRMGEAAIKGQQWQLVQDLNGVMGKDMMDVLSGKKKVELTFWRKVKSNINKFFLNLRGNGI